MPLKVQIVTQEGPLFEEPAADMVVIPGTDGEMGVLPHHAALLSTLGYGELRVRKGNAEESFIVYGGIVEVRPDSVIVLADTGESTYDVDEAKAQSARQSAEQLMREGLPPDKAAIAAQEYRRAGIQENILRKIKSRPPTMRIKSLDENGKPTK